jgi:hypothetical protein
MSYSRADVKNGLLDRCCMIEVREEKCSPINFVVVASLDVRNARDTVVLADRQSDYS